MTSTIERLRELMIERYQTDSLVVVSPDVFKARLDEYLQVFDYEMEGYSDHERQRDQSVKFQWGHDHDFGAFTIPGLMRDRHLAIPARLIDSGYLPLDLTGKRILEIGCWTGGMSLLLAAMGAKVVAFEEVRKYADVAAYLARSFNADVSVRGRSLYDLCEGEGVDDVLATEFDFVFLSGVLYHVTDPVLALRITFNSLRDGGTCLIETACIAGDGLHVRYGGPTRVIGNKLNEKNRTRQGWNWFIPTVDTLVQMLYDVGYVKVDTFPHGKGDRVYARAIKDRQTDMLRAGMSNRRVR